MYLSVSFLKIYRFTAKSTHSIYDIIKWDCTEYFDKNDYPTDNSYGIQSNNKKTIGQMKDELNG